MSRGTTSPKNLEGTTILFKGDDVMDSRKGIVTDVITQSNMVVILWDTDEYTRSEEKGGTVLSFDNGVSVYTIHEILDSSKFMFLTN